MATEYPPDSKELSMEKVPSEGLGANRSIENGLSGTDSDADRLAKMGYSQDMKRKFSIWSVLAVGFSLTNSWWAISAALVTGINSGGSFLLVYGTIVVAIVSVGVGITLAELVSAMPNAAGQIFWAAELAPPKYARVAAHSTGWLAWAGSVFACASVSLSVSAACVGCYQLAHPDFEIKTWHIFIGYQIVNAFAGLFNCVGRTLPLIATLSLYMTLISFLVILIAVPAAAPTHQHASFVFATFVNNTGWKQGAIAFITGFINVNWGFSCLDTVVHMAEEIHQPERMLPISIMATIGIGFVTSLAFTISMMFSLNDFDLVAGTATGVPILELFYQAFGHNKGGAIFLEAMIIASGIGCQIACHTWASRICWSFARDGGVPYSNVLSKINKRLDVPLNAHLMSCFLVAVLGCLYLASLAAMNSIITGCIVLPYLSYCPPVISLLMRGRNSIRHGPFWLGKLGMVANYVTLIWTLFCLVFYSFPSYMPAEGNSMNYISAVYGIVAIAIVLDWFLRARKVFRGPGEVVIDGIIVSS
ncbi:choline transport protein [Ophiostoma piceae UAMH 11346]|uniref:Choline transport protein n=1 Tax=Ophiostoma piceae (strain UAMH 11346) TaxID=1262450 RepID=S3C741_OPHP1|nr:choline transport protein [Ophiostoma piceae UAMH 11346]